jgi:hypothetical protein
MGLIGLDQLDRVPTLPFRDRDLLRYPHRPSRTRRSLWRPAATAMRHERQFVGDELF